MQFRDAKVFQALTNLRGNGDFNTFVEALKAAEMESLLTCRMGEGAPLHRAQGSSQTLRELLDTIAQAPTTLEKFKSNQR